jgi:hypothetical protein
MSRWSWRILERLMVGCYGGNCAVCFYPKAVALCGGDFWNLMNLVAGGWSCISFDLSVFCHISSPCLIDLISSLVISITVRILDIASKHPMIIWLIILV